jgi:hypothetical protein
MTKATRAALFLLLLATSTFACRKRSEEASSTHVTSAATTVPSTTAASPAPTATTEPKPPPPKPFVASHPVPPFKGAFPHRPEPNASASGRVVSIKFVRNGGDDDVMPVLALTNLTTETVRVKQTWIFYHDAQKKLLDRYPHAVGDLELAPGETKEHRLGLEIKKFPKNTSYVEGEVSRATVGGKEWQNENLVAIFRRPLGGPDLQTLEDNAGERLIVDVYAIGSNRVRFTNVTDRTITQASIMLHFADRKGDVNFLMAPYQKLKKPLGPGESVDFTLDILGNERPPASKVTVIAFAYEVQFTDESTFRNRNLEQRDGWLALAPK